MGIDINTLKISIGRVDCLLLNIFISNGQAQQHHPKRTSPQALVETKESYSLGSASCQA